MSQNGPDSDERLDESVDYGGSSLAGASEADVVEQHLAEHESVTGTPPSDEVDPADAYEQAQEVEYDEDDYR